MRARVRAGVRDSTALAVGSVTAGLLAYAFFALSTRSLGVADAAPVSVLWTYWSFTAAALTFPLQHWIVRSVAAGGEGGVRVALPQVLLLVAALAAVAGALAWVARSALFGRDDPWFPLLVGFVTLGSALMGVVRGSLSARRRFLAVSAALVLENGTRCLTAAVLTATGTQSAVAMGGCLAVGSLVGLAWPSSLALRREPAGTGPASPLRFLGGASAGQLMAQAVLTGGPVVLALGGGSAAQVTTLFAALALFRAPYTLAIGLVSAMTGRLTVLFLRDRNPALGRVRLLVLAGSIPAAAVAGVIGALAGPLLLRAVFGEQVRLSALLSALVAVGNAVAVASLVMALMVLAQGRGIAVARAWSLAIVAGALVVALPQADMLDRTCWAFVAAEVVALVALAVEERRGSTHREPFKARPDSASAWPGPAG